METIKERARQATQSELTWIQNEISDLWAQYDSEDELMDYNERVDVITDTILYGLLEGGRYNAVSSLYREIGGYELRWNSDSSFYRGVLSVIENQVKTMEGR